MCARLPLTTYFLPTCRLNMRDRQSLVEADHLAEPGAHTDVATTALTQNAPYRLNTLPTEVATVPPNTQVSSRPASPACHPCRR